MVRITKDDIPVIVSVFISASTIFIGSLSNTVKFPIMLFILLLGWYIRKLIKDRKMGEVKEIIEKIDESAGYIDVGKIGEKVPVELKPFIDTLGKLLNKIQEYEIEKIEVETLKSYSKEAENLREELKRAKEKIEIAERKLNYLQIIYDITSKIVSTLDVNAILDFITKMLGEKLKVGKAAILMKDEDGETLIVKSTYGFGPNIKGMKFSLTEGVSGLVFSTGETIYIPDTRRDRRYLHWKGEYYEEGSFLSIPIKYGDEVMGVLNFNKSEIGGFSEEEIELLKRIADQTAIAIKNAQLFDEIKNMYGKDPLTGLLTRGYMSKRIEKLIKDGTPFGFILFDIDKFRNINLRYGYEVGDTVLVEISNILRKELRKVDIISRFGGDEFAIAIVGGNKDDSKREAKRISEFIKEIKISPIHKGNPSSKRYSELSETVGEASQEKGEEIITISVGLTAFPEEGEETKQIFEIADRRLLLAKIRGGNTIES